MRRLSSKVRRRIHASGDSAQSASLFTAALSKPALRNRANGFLDWVFKRKTPTTAPLLPPLQVALPGVKLLPDLSDEEQLRRGVETRMSRLPNGLTVASENTPGQTATVGVYVETGSVDENEYNSGVTHLLERMGFNSTVNRSHHRLVREVEAIGGYVHASASREQISYTGDVIRSYLPEVVELLADSVRNPAFHEWEVKEQASILKNEIEELKKNPQAFLLESLHPAGYKGALGNRLVPLPAALDRLDSRALHEFVSENYTASRIVIAGAGVEHEHLLSLVKPLFEDMPLVEALASKTSQYVGGDWRLQSESDEEQDQTHVSIAFEVPGGWQNKRDALAAIVLQFLLGGGGSFSAGGPGKGVLSRLYTNVLVCHPEVESCTAFTSVYNDSGLLGIHASAKPSFSTKLVELMAEQLISVACPGEVKEVELERAKNAAISLSLMNLESLEAINEDIARQILCYGSRKPVAEFTETIEALTMNDLHEIAYQIISTPLCMASYGNVSKVPAYELVSSYFQET